MNCAHERSREIFDIFHTHLVNICRHFEDHFGDARSVFQDVMHLVDVAALDARIAHIPLAEAANKHLTHTGLKPWPRYPSLLSKRGAK